MSGRETKAPPQAGSDSAPGPATPSRYGTLGVWFRFLRVGLLPTALSNLVLGYAVESASHPARSWSEIGLDLAPPGAVVALLYLFGMGLNDFVDRQRDATIRPDRPLPSGEISVRTAALALGMLLGLALLGATLASLEVAAWALAIVIGILTYDLVTKSHSILGPAAMGSVRLFLVLLGGAVANPEGGRLELSTWIVAASVGAYVASLTFFSMEEEQSRPQVLARRRILVFAVLLLAGLAPAATALIAEGTPVSWLGTIPWLLCLGWAWFRAFPPSRGPAPGPGLTTFRLLQGLLLLDLALLVTYDHLPFAGISAALWIWVLRGFPFPSRR